MASWYDRVRSLTEPYSDYKRKSLHMCVLYEALRIVQPHCGELRSFQRHIAVLNQAFALVETLDFLTPHERKELLQRSNSEPEEVTPEEAWRRSKMVGRELERFGKEMAPFVAEGRSHLESVAFMVADRYKPRQGVPSSKWEFGHHSLLAFKVYYNGTSPDPTFPEPGPATEIVVPTKRLDELEDDELPTFLRIPGTSGAGAHIAAPAQGAAAITGANNTHSATSPLRSPTGGGVSEVAVVAEYQDPGTKSYDVMRSPANSTLRSPPAAAGYDMCDDSADAATTSERAAAQDRRNLLQEVKNHLELLESFEGFVPEQELANRKRELFLALPSAPPPAAAGSSSKKPRRGEQRP